MVPHRPMQTFLTFVAVISIVSAETILPSDINNALDKLGAPDALTELALASREAAANSDSQHRRSLATGAAATSVPVCLFGTNLGRGGYCNVNPEWLALQKGKTQLAKFDIQDAKNKVACNRYLDDNNPDTTSPKFFKQLDACNSDTQHFCYVKPDGTSSNGYRCTSWTDALSKSMNIPCKGSLHENVIKCSALPNAQCSSNLDCWDASQFNIGSGRSAQQMTETRNKAYKYGFCLAKAAKSSFPPAADIDNSNGTTATQAYSAWALATINSPDPEVVKRTRGTCPYGNAAILRVAYSGLCNSVNDPKLGLFYSAELGNRAISSDSMRRCVLSDCDAVALPGEALNTTTVGSAICVPKMFKFYSLGYYTEARLLAAAVACYSSPARFDRQVCESAVLPATIVIPK